MGTNQEANTDNEEVYNTDWGPIKIGTTYDFIFKENGKSFKITGQVTMFSDDLTIMFIKSESSGFQTAELIRVIEKTG